MKADFTKNGTAGFAGKWLFRKFIAANAFHMFKGYFLMIQIIILSYSSTPINFLTDIVFKFLIISILVSYRMTMTNLLLLMIITLQLNRMRSCLKLIITLSLFFFLIIQIILVVLVQSIVLFK